MSKAIPRPQLALSKPRPRPSAEAAKWLRPGVVVHEPCATADALLIDFAGELRARGFRVGGYARKPQPAGASPLSVDLATGASFVEEPRAARRRLEQAISEGADLFAVGRFPACADAAGEVGLPIGPTSGRGLPVLTAIAGAAIHHTHSFVRLEGTMIAPDRRDLWRWWGPERLYDDLILGVPETETIRVVCGLRWVLVEGRRGAGLAPLPRPGGEFAARADKLRGESLATLARLARSLDPLETALGVAAINAHYNRFDFAGFAGDGAAAFRSAPSPVAVIGAFPDIGDVLPECAVVEASPRPGALSFAALDTLLPACGAALVNSSALVNRSLQRILRLARQRPVGLVGPATPLASRLHAYGLSVLGGFVVHDASGLAGAVAAGAPAREFVRFGRLVHIRA